MMMMLKLDSKYVVCKILEKLAGTGLYVEVYKQTNYWQLVAFEVHFYRLGSQRKPLVRRNY